MQEWVYINECDIGTPNIYRFPQVDGLSTGPPELGCHTMHTTDLRLCTVWVTIHGHCSKIKKGTKMTLWIWGVIAWYQSLGK